MEGRSVKYLAPLVQRADNSIQRIGRYSGINCAPTNTIISRIATYSLDRVICSLNNRGLFGRLFNLLRTLDLTVV